MASSIKIKRSEVAGNPTVLGAGELAYSSFSGAGGDRLYIGTGVETAGDAVNHVVIGGKFFTDMITAATDANTASTLVKRDSAGSFSIFKTIFSGETSGTVSLIANAVAGTNTITLPASTGTVALTANKLSAFAATTSAELAGVISDETGSGALVFANTPTLVTPTIGAATATTINKVTITAPTTSATLTLVTGSSLITAGAFALTLTSTAATNVTLPTTGTLATLTGTETLSNKTLTGLAGITSTAALSITAGGTNTSITLAPNGTGTVDVSSKRITSLADPTGAQDAATKAYVDATKSGLDIKNSVHVGTTANLTATASGTGTGKTLTNSGTQAALVIDGITLVATDRVLVKNQTAGQDNGIYTVTNVGSASTNWILTRATDADNTPTGEVTAGMFCFVEEGTENADNAYVLTTNDSIVLDTTALVFTQFSGAGQVTDGAGLTKSGNTLAVQVGTGIAIVSDTVTLASTVAGAGLTFTTGVLAVGGTASRITVAADSIDIASTYVGQSSITTLGTVATGTWQATAIALGYGGTGFTTYAAGDIIYASAANTLSKLAKGTDGQFLQLVSGAPAWVSIDGGEY